MAHNRSIDDAPGPSGFGLIRTLRGLNSDPLGTLEKAAERFGPIYDVPAGTTLALCIYLAQRKASSWAEPARFLPERFLDDGARRKLLAFGMGPRGCAGAGFAVDEMTLALAGLIGEFRLSVTAPVAARGGVTLRTRVPLFATVSSL